MSEERRAFPPDREGHISRSGVRLHYEVSGVGDPPLLFLPAWDIVHARTWKFQVPYFARRHRVVTVDPRGNGRSGRPTSPEAYTEAEHVRDAIDVMDEAGIARAVVVAFSRGAWHAALLAAQHPDRVLGMVLAGSSSPLGGPSARAAYPFDEVLPTGEGWAKYNRHYWRRDYRGFVEFFISRIFTEPHSTKHIEDAVGWGLETTADVLTASEAAPRQLARLREDQEAARAVYRSIRCPLLIVHGSDDAIVPWSRGAAIAEVTGAPLVTIAGGGHHLFAREPVRMNLLLREFIDRRVIA